MKATATALLVLTLAGCLPESSPATGPQQVGRVTVKLQSMGPSGAFYQLCNATFELTGPQAQTILDNTCPDSAASIDIDTLPGLYSVLMSGAWEIQHSINGLPFTAIPATLVSPNPSPVIVTAGQVSPLVLTFNVEEGDIDFGFGTIGVTIVVDEVDGGS